MTERENNLLMKVVERFLFHSSYETDNPELKETAEKMMEIELLEMWMITQKGMDV